MAALEAVLLEFLFAAFKKLDGRVKPGHVPIRKLRRRPCTRPTPLLRCALQFCVSFGLHERVG
jgi:hypothetical protein